MSIHIKNLYNAESSRHLAPYYELILSRRAEIVDWFYRKLDQHELHVLAELSDAERARLVVSQVAYLEQIFSPDLTEPEHREMASRIGEIHDAVSLSPVSLLHAFKIYQQSIFRYVPEIQADVQATAVLQQRLENDLAWQLIVYWRAEGRRTKMFSELTELIETQMNVADVLQQFSQGLLNRKIALCGISLFNLQKENVPELEFSAGEFSGAILLEPDDGGRSAMTNMLFEVRQTMQPVWLSRASVSMTSLSASMVRSMAVLPVFRDHGTVDRLLVLCARFPNYFGAEEKRFFFTLLAHELAIRLNQLQQYSGMPHRLQEPEREHYLELLRNNRIEMVFQPIVDASNRQIVKFEALARLVDDDGRLIAPGLFLPALGTRHLLELFLSGLQQACAVLRQRPAEQNYGVSVNLPTEAFEYPAILNRIMAVIEQYAVDPGDITLEILESSLNTGEAAAHVQRLKSSGVRIALDDVGSGESSLLRLKMLAINEIKIDQSLTKDLCAEPDKLAVVHMLMRLATQLGVHCVVEGVENDIILDMVKTLGGASIQGYAVSHPIRSGDVHAWVAEYTRTRGIEESGDSLPGSLHAWYARHLSRSLLILDAFPDNVDLIALHQASDACSCPLTAFLAKQNLQDSPVAWLHQRWHELVQELARLEPSRRANVEAIKQELMLVTRGIGTAITKEIHY